MLKIVFLSNFFNHHQKPLSDALYTHQNVKYFFIATSQMPAERKQLGYHMSELPEYVLTAYNDKQREAVQTLIYDADIVIVGSAPERMLRERIRCGKLIFRYSERPLKKGMSYIKFLPRVFKWNLQNPFWKPIYMLCASAYTASDYAKHGAFVHKCYKWGYFPETKCYYDVSSFMAEKDKTAILWAGRFLKWKHPDDAIEIARRLKNDGYKYSLTVVGCGEMESELKVKIAEYGLHEYVRLAGAMPPEQVRKHMEKSGIYLFTSDRNEGGSCFE